MWSHFPKILGLKWTSMASPCEKMMIQVPRDHSFTTWTWWKSLVIYTVGLTSLRFRRKHTVLQWETTTCLLSEVDFCLAWQYNCHRWLYYQGLFCVESTDMLRELPETYNHLRWGKSSVWNQKKKRKRASESQGRKCETTKTEQRERKGEKLFVPSPWWWSQTSTRMAKNSTVAALLLPHAHIPVGIPIKAAFTYPDLFIWVMLPPLTTPPFTTCLRGINCSPAPPHGASAAINAR